VFCMDVVKVDRDVAYVAMVAHVCCNRLFSMFHLFFRRMMLVCLSGYCIYLTHMLQVFYLDVTYVLQWFSSVFCKCFRHMFQVFHLSSDVCCKCCIWIFQK
jgi:hypothetical protein